MFTTSANQSSQTSPTLQIDVANKDVIPPLGQVHSWKWDEKLNVWVPNLITAQDATPATSAPKYQFFMKGKTDGEDK